MTAHASADAPGTPSGALPWWRHGMVWFVIAGPAAVVVPGAVTIVLAYRQADPALSPTPTASSLAARATTPTASSLAARATTPAAPRRSAP